MTAEVLRRAEVRGRRGVVASPNDLATQAGMQMYQLGGNAVDAAVAANAALCVVQGHQCGVGGDAFAMLRPAGAAPVVLNGSGRTPAALDLEMYTSAGHDYVPMYGGLSVTVPGTVRAWADLVERYGKLDLSASLAPAIEYAGTGFPVSGAMAQTVEGARERLVDQPPAARAYLPGGEPLVAGRIARLSDLAGTLEAIAGGGPKAFYEGPIAEAMVAAIQADGGALTLDDLANHESLWQDPLVTTYRGIEIFQCPPNSQGLAAVIQLALLEDEDVGALGHLSSACLERMLAAARTAAAERNRVVGDPDEMDRAVVDAGADEWRRRLAGTRDAPAARPEVGGTVVVSAADEDGNVVCLLETLYVPFGSGLVAGETGVFVQNRAAFMDVAGDGPNRVRPHVRPRHTLMPGMLRQGDQVTAIGARGADGQSQTMVQMVTAMADFGLGFQACLEAPRWLYGGILPTHPQDTLFLESRFAERAAEGLRAVGYEVEVVDDWSPLVGVGQIASYGADGVLTAASDPRANGSAAAC